MALKLMYITNDPEVASIAQEAGVDRITVDLEYIGKAKRQGGMDTVQSHHTIADVRAVRQAVTEADLLVRCNPLHGRTEEYGSSQEEIDAVVEAGADIVMLPFFKTVGEAELFIKMVNGRCRTILLLETPEAVDALEDILALKGIDGIHIGINDLSLGMGRTFMFELLADGTVEEICLKIRKAGIPYGFGGIAAIGSGTLPAEAILKEHYRLGSSMVILSRTFCNCEKIRDYKEIRRIFMTEIRKMREKEEECARYASYFEENRKLVAERTEMIRQSMLSKKDAAV